MHYSRPSHLHKLAFVPRIPMPIDLEPVLHNALVLRAFFAESISLNTIHDRPIVVQSAVARVTLGVIDPFDKLVVVLAHKRLLVANSAESA